MYTENDLAEAVSSKNYTLVAEISTALAHQAVNPPKAKGRPKKVKEVEETLPLPAPTDGTPSWMAPSLAGRPKKFDENGRELIEGVFTDVPKVDHSKVRFETDKQPAPGLTAAQKKAERLKKAPRDFSMQREPVKKVAVECESCGKDFKVYPSALSKREADHSVDLYYTCEKCIRGNKRG